MATPSPRPRTCPQPRPPPPRARPPRTRPTPNKTDEHERWQRFAAGDPDAPAAESPPPGRWRAVGRGLRRAARSEWTLAGLCSILLAVAMTWPLAKHLQDRIPHDAGDPLLLTYILGWVGHALRENPAGIWDTNSFWPLDDAYLFTDTLMGYAPAALLATSPASALVVYNVLYIGTFALAFLGAYALLRQLGARVAGSAVAATAFAYAPWKLGQAGHLQVLSCGGIALALAMLARGHGYSLRGGFKPERQRPGWIVAGWLTALWQFSIGAGLGIPFVYLLLGVGVVVGLHWLAKRPSLRWQTLAANGIGGTVFSLGVLWIADRHAVVARAYPEAVRDVDYISWFSPTWQSFIISPEESRSWGAAHEAARADLTWAPEQALLVGFTLFALAVAGLIWSCWTGWQRLWLALGGAVVFAISMGPNFLDHGSWAWALLYEYAPGWDAIRTPGRLVIYLTLILAVLAAGTLTRIADDADEVVASRPCRQAFEGQGAQAGPCAVVRADRPGPVGGAHGRAVCGGAGGACRHVRVGGSGAVPACGRGRHEGPVLESRRFPGGRQRRRRVHARLSRRASARCRRVSRATDAIEALRGAGIETVVVLPGSLPG